MSRITKDDLRKVMREISSRDENTGPLYEFVSQEVYDHWKALGKNMTYVRVNKPLPTNKNTPNSTT